MFEIIKPYTIDEYQTKYSIIGVDDKLYKYNYKTI